MNDSDDRDEPFRANLRKMGNDRLLEYRVREFKMTTEYPSYQDEQENREWRLEMRRKRELINEELKRRGLA